jgi:hypothetical protein
VANATIIGQQEDLTMATTKPRKGSTPKSQMTGPLADAVDPDQAMTAFGQFHLAARDIVRRDAKGRVTLGKLGTDGDGFRVYINDLGQVLLDPIVAIPAREQWLFKDPERAKALDRALAQSEARDVIPLPSFAHMLENEGE